MQTFDIEELHRLIKKRIASCELLNVIEKDMVAARTICEFFLGEEWTKTKIDYSTTDLGSIHEALINDSKLFRVGHYLYELKSIRNFSEMLNNLRKRDFDSVFWELYSAHFFFEAGNYVQFVKQSGIKGKDFDLQVTNRDERVFNVECKDRASSGTTIATLFNAIKKAQGQFPQDNFDNVVHIQIPEGFINEQIELDVCAYLLQAERIKMAILTYWKWQVDTLTIVGFPIHTVLSVQADFDELPMRTTDDGDIPTPGFTRLYRF